MTPALSPDCLRGLFVALATALNELTAEPELLAEMGKAGHERLVERDWTWRGNAERLTELHREAIE